MKAVFFALSRGTVAVAFALLAAQAAHAQLQGVPAVHGDLSRALLGDGTGVIIGSVDSGVATTHPVLAGNDSLGNPRLVAEQNFVTSEPTNTGEDVFGHGTWTASIMLSSDPTYTGFAPDARYVDARVLDSTNSFTNSAQVMNGIGFAISNGAQVINLSMNYLSAQNTGTDPIERMIDWAAENMNVNFTISAGNISTGDGTTQVRGPASAYNGVTVGRTTATFDQVHFDSSVGPTGDGRAKPDVVAPGTQIIMANENWQTGPLWDPTPHNGTSFAAPEVAGLMAQEIDYGQVHHFSTNPLVIKAMIMNSAVKVLDKDGTAWKPAASSTVGGVMQSTSPLDTDQGAGQIDGVRLYQQYSAGQQGPGQVNSTGWDLHTVNGVASTTYNLGGQMAAGSLIDVTLDWFRHVTRIDNGNGIIDAADSYIVTGPLDNLDLTVLLNGVAIAKSMSTIDNVEYLQLTLPQSGNVSIEVDRLAVANMNPTAEYGLAWATAVPEPGTLVLAAVGICCWAMICRRRHRRPCEILPSRS
jgi:Subtilase family/PEP-CTERM motif